MSLTKAIKYGKEHRKEYGGAKSIDPMCRNHKGCDWCKGNRTYQSTKQKQKTDEMLKEMLIFHDKDDEFGVPTKQGEELAKEISKHVVKELNKYINGEKDCKTRVFIGEKELKKNKKERGEINE